MKKILLLRSVVVILVFIIFAGTSQLTAMERGRDRAALSSSAQDAVVCSICGEKIDMHLPITDPYAAMCGTQMFDGCSPSHLFHGKCLARWIREKGTSVGCPLCRKKLYVAEASESPVTSRPAELPVSTAVTPAEFEVALSIDAPMVASPHIRAVAPGEELRWMARDSVVLLHGVVSSEASSSGPSFMLWSGLFGYRCLYDAEKQQLVILVHSSIDSGIFEQIARKWPMLQRLRIKGGLTTLPAAIGTLTNLRELNLTENHLEELPVEVGHLVHLRKLKLRNNQLRYLPLAALAHLHELCSINLRNNPISALSRVSARLQAEHPGIEVWFTY